MKFILLLLMLSLLYIHGAIAHESSAFDFIKPLQGLKKGDRSNGIPQLKQYLENFGYLNPNACLGDDLFDGQMESAIKTYQINYNLNVTGFLDLDTISIMTTPRCSYPDIINGTTRMNSGLFGSGDHHPLYWFPNNTKRWPIRRDGKPIILTYSFPRDFNRRFKFRIELFGFSQWNRALPQIQYASTTSFGNATFNLRFGRRDHGDTAPFDGPGGVVAHADPPNGKSCQCHFDADESWVVGEVPGALDIGTVALHEIGHMLGLGHSSDINSAMYAHGSIGTQRRLNQDDINGIRALYGVR